MLSCDQLTCREFEFCLAKACNLLLLIFFKLFQLGRCRHELVKFAETHSQNIGSQPSRDVCCSRSPSKGQVAPGTWENHLTFLCRKQDKDYEEAEEQPMIVLQSCPSMLTLANWVESRISSWRYFSFGTEDMKLQLDHQRLVVLITLLSQLCEAEPSVDVRMHIEIRHLDCPHKK